MVFSLTNGANITEAEWVTEGRGYWSRTLFEWRQDSKGLYYASKIHRWVSPTGNSRNPEEEQLVEIKEFDVNPDIYPWQFTIIALGLPPGTLVEDKLSGRRYRYGGELKWIPESVFEELARRIAGEGFAAPKR
jgi:hypothetical protein